MQNLRVPLRILFYQADGQWIAHCLEFDLIGDGATKEQAMARMFEAIAIQVQVSLEYNNPENLFKPADSRYFLMFAAGRDVASGEHHFKLDSVTIDHAETREYSESEHDHDKHSVYAGS